MSIETERKFLIRYPDTDMLLSMEGCACVQIEQVYLLNDSDNSDEERRIRHTVTNSEDRYYLTVKSRGDGFVRREDERGISRDEYVSLSTLADPLRQPIRKTRYKLPYNGRRVEIDIYPFWSDRAIAEVELDSPDEELTLPPFITVIKEVTFEPEYKNSALARGSYKQM